MIKYFVRTTGEREFDYSPLEVTPLYDYNHDPINSFIDMLEIISEYDSVLLEDDLILCKNFQNEIEKAIAEYPNDVINFFTYPADYFLTDKAVRRFGYNQCTYYPKELSKKLSEEMRGIMKWWPKDSKLWSEVLNSALRRLAIPHVRYRPCLVQHNDKKSILYEQVGRDPGTRTTIWFKDYLDELGLDYKTCNTRENVKALTELRDKHLFSDNQDMPFPIDLVVPYVDMDDPQWQQTAKQANIKIDKTRFRGQGDFFKYFFRGLDKNLPWLNNVFLIVQSYSQVPNWLNKDKIKIVLHENFIPNEYLPVFNSCTIEMFLQNIPELSEHFIYLNDDLFVMKFLTPDKFFGKDCVYQRLTSTFPSGMWGKHTKNACELIYDNKVKGMVHGPSVLLKSKMIECFNKYETQIRNSISKTREDRNINSYLYCFYLDKIGLTKPTTVDSTLFFEGVYKFLDNQFNHFLCIQDPGSFNIYLDSRLNEEFSRRFPNKSKYEL